MKQSNIGQSIRIGIGKYKSQEFVVPELSGIVEHIRGETLMHFGVCKINKINYRQVWGVGRVRRISKGDKFDLVYISFGIEHKWKRIIVIDNFARRQIMTLKRGQICQVYGVCRYFTTDVKLKGQQVKGQRLGLYAKGIQGWYVPKVMDIINVDPNDVEELTKENESKIDFIDKLIMGEEEL